MNQLLLDSISLRRFLRRFSARLQPSLPLAAVGITELYLIGQQRTHEIGIGLRWRKQPRRAEACRRQAVAGAGRRLYRRAGALRRHN